MLVWRRPRRFAWSTSRSRSQAWVIAVASVRSSGRRRPQSSHRSSSASALRSQDLDELPDGELRCRLADELERRHGDARREVAKSLRRRWQAPEASRVEARIGDGDREIVAVGDPSAIPAVARVVAEAEVRERTRDRVAVARAELRPQRVFGIEDQVAALGGSELDRLDELLEQQQEVGWRAAGQLGELTGEPLRHRAIALEEGLRNKRPDHGLGCGWLIWFIRFGSNPGHVPRGARDRCGAITGSVRGWSVGRGRQRQGSPRSRRP